MRRYIVLDYATGGDLDDQIRSNRKRGTLIPEARIMRWFAQLCRAIEYLHNRGLIHGNPKPLNILRESDGRTKLCDFGATRKAMTVEESPEARKAWLDAGMMIRQRRPSELLDADVEGVRGLPIDIWVLGVTLYELCTCGEFPFDRRHALTHVPPALPAVYSKKLQNLVDSLLTKDPGRRPTIQEILALKIVKNAGRPAPSPWRPGSRRSGTKCTSPHQAGLTLCLFLAISTTRCQSASLGGNRIVGRKSSILSA